jgi:hypothetical protein
VRVRMSSRSNSAICGAPHIADYAERAVMRSANSKTERKAA